VVSIPSDTFLLCGNAQQAEPYDRGEEYFFQVVVKYFSEKARETLLRSPKKGHA
jgi:hypothetical protein